MSTFEHIALQHSPSHGLSDPLTLGLLRRLSDFVAYLRGEVRVSRLAVWCGFAGAVLLQAGVLSLLFQLVLRLDTFLLPSLTASVACLAIGSLGMLTSRLLGESQPAA